MPRPPTPTLFPYTTLFRSHRELRVEGRRLQQPHHDGLRSERRHQAGEIASVRGARRAAEARRDGEGLHDGATGRSEEHTSELQSLRHLVCRLLLEKKKKR